MSEDVSKLRVNNFNEGERINKEFESVRKLVKTEKEAQEGRTETLKGQINGKFEERIRKED
jgi:hypothetical protein